MLPRSAQEPLDRLCAHEALLLAPYVLDHADDGAVAVGGRAFAHVEHAADSAHAVLHLAPAVRGDLAREPGELDLIGRLHCGRIAAWLDAFAAQAAGLD